MVNWEQIQEGLIRYDVLFDINNPDTILMQFTGLKDKNGKEIYEFDLRENGHIVKWNTLHCCWGWFDEIGNFKEELMGNGFIELGIIDETDYEIIGNIHENPNLLK